ncbi:hypothetical protein BGX31_011156 [Mortierella sp. GBA43]|nr:hypothetical protein BGX31_011156 [Mortierella sp. GBA43]
MGSCTEDSRGDMLSSLLRETHAQNLAAYKRIIAEAPTNITSPALDLFWDVVVVTAGDTQQRLVYERRIDQELHTKRIPSRAKYHVIEDPPNSKIGSGGSTLLVMKTLKDSYSQEFLASARILLIHAGGYTDSSRGIQVLELKLVLYLHLVKSMPPGVFLTSADGIELFASKDPFPNEIKPYTITALAHPSSTRIGSTHGVYLLQDPDNQVANDRTFSPREQSAILLKCERFVHKPSPNVMKSIDNLIYRSSTDGAQDVVYTDGCYYFDPQTASVMANTYDILPSDCDLEAWADILSFQDQLPSSIQPSSDNVASDDVEIPLVVRSIVSRALRAAGVSLEVMVLNASKFYHLGTMEEFIVGTCTDKEFMSELHIHNTVPGIARVHMERRDGLQQDQLSNLQAPAYVENSLISSGVIIQPHSIIVDSNLPTNAFVPAGTCLFTLQLQESEFVTLTFSVKDDMKKTASNRGKPLVNASALENLHIFEQVPVSHTLPPSGSGTPPLPPMPTEVTLSLWTAPVFEIARSRDESVQLALNRLHRIQHHLQQAAPGTLGAGINQDDPIQPTILGWTSLKAAASRARSYYTAIPITAENASGWSI